MKKFCILLVLGICGFLSSCTTTRTYHVTETTFHESGPVVKESVVVMKRTPSRIYIEEVGPDFVIVERPYFGPTMFSHRFYHYHPRCYRYYPRSEAQVHFGFGVGFHN